MVNPATPGWVHPGAVVGCLHTRHDAVMTGGTIDRLTATLIVLTDGRRFRLRNGRSIHDDQYRLVPLTDRTYRRAVARQTVDDLSYRLQQLLDVKPTDVEDAVQTLLDVETSVAAARARLVELITPAPDSPTPEGTS